MFELLTFAFLQFFALSGQPASTVVGGTGWGDDVTSRTAPKSMTVGGTGWGDDITKTSASTSSAVGGTGWGDD